MAVVKGMSRRGEINLEKIDDRMFNIFAPVEVDSLFVIEYSSTLEIH